jgi:anti-anti-sigma factor
MQMQLDRFEARVRQAPGGDLAIVDLRGEIDARAEQALNRAYDEATRSKPSTVLFHFGQVDYINSTGIALIVGLLARARTEHRSVQACGLSSHYRHIFEITRLADFLRIVPDEPAALAAGGAIAP